MTATSSLSCVILTRGDRPKELRRAVDSLRDQRGSPIEIIVVVNGGGGIEVPEGITVVELPANEGVPGGRNVGIEQATGDIIIFLDDDGWLPDRGSAERLRHEFAREQPLGIVSFRILDPHTGRTERRHVPRLRVGDPERSSYVTTFLGGACAIRRDVLRECGPFPTLFFYGHEETDFAWRALDLGHRIRYDAGFLMYHPGGPAADRHISFHHLTARNRVWLARRRLPSHLIPVYLTMWALLTLVRERRLSAIKAWTSGFLEGLRIDCGPRQPISWRTVVRMTRLGRPPVI